MTEKIRKCGLAMIVCCLFFSLCLIPVSSVAQTLPEPGTIINASNIDQYKDFFPEEVLPAFKDGWGVITPITIKFEARTPRVRLKPDLAADELNRGKYQLDSEKYPALDYKQLVGQPFYGVTPDDPDFVIKQFWNVFYRYDGKDSGETLSGLKQWTRRRGETRIGVDDVYGPSQVFAGRVLMDPKPYIPTKNNWRSASMSGPQYPPVMKNLIGLTWVPLDPREDNMNFTYVPALRRVMRGETGEKSTPRNNSTQAPDDFGMFAGRIPEFTFKYLGDKKVIACVNAPGKEWTIPEAHQETKFPVSLEGWQLVDTYIFEIHSVDANYPQSKKIIYMNKEYPVNHYGFAWDRAGALWKCWWGEETKDQVYKGEHYHHNWSQAGIDIQLGYATIFHMNLAEKYKNQRVYKESNFTTKALRDFAK